MAVTRQREASAAPGVVLLDGNLLVALVDEAHVHHAQARAWFAGQSFGFATCQITQGTLLRLLMRIGGLAIEEATSVLLALTQHASHHFWPDARPYERVQWQGVMGDRQVTDAYLAALARQHGSKLASFDRGLMALHGDVAIDVMN